MSRAEPWRVAAIRFLSADEVAALERRVAEVEGRSGTQVVVACVGRADRYPEIPWRAFALGVAVAGLAAALVEWGRPDWVGARVAFLTALAMLGAGALAAAATLAVPALARLFVRPLRAEAEVREYARALFLDHELFRVPARTGVLLVASLFERQVVVVPDRGFAGRCTGSDWQGVVAAVTGPLRAGARPATALLAGLDALEELLARTGWAPSPGDGSDLPDRPVQDPGVGA